MPFDALYDPALFDPALFDTTSSAPTGPTTTALFDGALFDSVLFDTGIVIVPPPPPPPTPTPDPPSAPAPVATTSLSGTFRPNERDVVRVPKLNALNSRLDTLERSTGGGELAVSITDLPYAEATVPLVRWLLAGGVEFVSGAVSAAVGATNLTVLPIKKNGVANGTVAFLGTTGVVSMTNLTYLPGDLFELYPPATADATLDQVSITFTTI